VTFASLSTFNTNERGYSVEKLIRDAEEKLLVTVTLQRE
jgi:hypothetical protein